MNVEDFIATWHATTIKETGGYQMHFAGLCSILGVEPPGLSEAYMYQKSAVKIGAKGNDFADIFKQGCFIAEYKSQGNLNEAISQVQKYARSLGNPPLLLAINWTKIQVSVSFTSTEHALYSFDIEDLRDPAVRARLRAMFDPVALKSAWDATSTRNELTKKVANHVVVLAADLYRQGIEKDLVAKFLTQLIFALFSSDPFINLLDEQFLADIVKQAKAKPESFSKNLIRLFTQMGEQDGQWGADEVRYFNGKLYETPVAFDLSPASLVHVEKMLKYRWANLEPSIFGAMFENGLKADKKSRLGINYTSSAFIEQVVDAALIEDVRSVMDAALAECRSVTTAEKRVVAAGFKKHLQAIRVLDPTCGSGNFLYIAHRGLRGLEEEFDDIMFSEHGIDDLPTAVSIDNVSGIETEAFAAKLAAISIWIGDIQWHVIRRGRYDRRPVLPSSDNILVADSLLGGEDVDKKWDEATHIVANPPYLGGDKIRMSLGKEYRQKLLAKFKDVGGKADLACFFVSRIDRCMTRNKHFRRYGCVVKSNLPTDKASAVVFRKIAQEHEIFFAVRKKKWHDLSVRATVSLFCVRRKSSQGATLDGKYVDALAYSLKPTSQFFATRRVDQNWDLAGEGVKPAAAGFILSRIEATRMLNMAPVSPNAPYHQVIKPYAGREFFTEWLEPTFVIDFGGQAEEDAAAYAVPYQHLKDTVPIQRAEDYAARPSNDKKKFLNRDTEFQRRRPKMVEWSRVMKRMIANPITNVEHVFAFVPSSTVCSDSLLVVYKQDHLTLGILQSKAHRIWAENQTIAERQDKPRYRKTAVFDTFPFPKGMELSRPDEQRETERGARSIALAMEKICEWREGYLRPDAYFTLEPVFPAAPADSGLKEAWVLKPGLSKQDMKDVATRSLNYLHGVDEKGKSRAPAYYTRLLQALDDAVLDAYGIPRDAGDQQILDELIKLHKQAPGQQQELDFGF